MPKANKQPDEIPEEQVEKGEFPSRKDQFKPGQSGNPAGRRTAGAVIREWANSFAEADLTETELRVIARDKSVAWTKRAAAERILRTMEAGDLHEMEGFCNGVESLDELKAKGVNTEVIKKIKTKTFSNEHGTEITREVELHDRSGEDFDRICDRTEGKPHQTMDMNHDFGPRNPAEGEAAAGDLLNSIRRRLNPNSAGNN